MKMRGKRDTLTGFDFTEDAPLRPRKAMRAKCLECCAGSPSAVKRCPMTDCTLWPYRLGVGICTNREGEREKTLRSCKDSDAQRAALARARAARGGGAVQ